MPNVTVYVMTSWQNLPSKNTALEATNLNHIEQGIKNVTDFLNTLNADAGVYLCGAPFTQALLTKLNGIEAQANKYVLPVASDQTLGGVKVDGSTIIIDQNGVISGAGGSLETLSDVNIFEKEDGQFLKWDSTEGKWINATLEVVTALSALTDVDITTPEDGDVLKYNSTTDKWENGESGEVLDYNETMEALGAPEPVTDYVSDWKKAGEVTGTVSISIPTGAKELLLYGIHDNAGGYKVVATLIVPIVEDLLDSNPKYFDAGASTNTGMYVRWGITTSAVLLNTAYDNTTQVISSTKTILYYR